jgi:uncharacterized membrane protein YraQ (UPF0718 family)
MLRLVAIKLAFRCPTDLVNANAAVAALGCNRRSHSLPGREPASAALIRLKFGLLITIVACVCVGCLMSNDNASWELDVLGPQVGPHRSEILDLESRVNWSEQFVSQHERDIKQTRFETARIANELEHRITEQGQLIEGQGRLIRFLADGLFAVIAALFGGLAAAYVHGDIYWTAGFGVFVFLLTLLAGNFLFRGLAASLLSDPLTKQQERRNRNQRI